LTYAKTLTKRIVAQRTPLILERDYPNSLLPKNDPDYEEPTCCYCEQRFMPKSTLWTRTFEHFDNNSENQELWNLGWVHWKCNQDKKNDTDLQILAREIISRNRKWEESYNFELSNEKKFTENTEPIKPDSEIEISKTNYPIVEKYLTERITTDGKILYKNALASCAYICKKRTTNGSVQAARNYIDMLTSDEGPFMIIKDENEKKIIVKRHGN